MLSTDGALAKMIDDMANYDIVQELRDDVVDGMDVTAKQTTRKEKWEKTLSIQNTTRGQMAYWLSRLLNNLT